MLALQDDKARIIKWAVKNPAGKVLHVERDLGGSIGRVASTSGSIADSGKVRVALRSDGLGGWVVQSAYPY